MRIFILMTALLGLALSESVSASDTTITYQGQLQDGSGPVTGTPDMVFRLYDDLVAGNQVGADIVEEAVPVTDGLFQVELDFGAAYDQSRWLEVEVDGVELSPRQPITAAPVAINALNVPDDTLAQLDCSNNQIARWNGSDWVCSQDQDTQYSAGSGLLMSGTTLSLDTGFTDGRYWRQGGNVGTDPGSDFIGTTDNVPFEIRVDGVRALRVEPGEYEDPDENLFFSINLIGGASENMVEDGVGGATIAGGGYGDGPNIVGGSLGTISGGADNSTGFRFATVGGGTGNSAVGNHSTIAGGESNTATGFRSTVGGGGFNETGGASSTISGGRENVTTGNFVSIGGGASNQADGVGDVISGGVQNFASGQYSTVGGGLRNSSAALGATVMGGWDNAAGNSYATVGGGRDNIAGGQDATVAGGLNNIANGFRSSIPGGSNNVANGNYSFAAGLRAKAEHAGTFVWADSENSDFTSTEDRQFLIRAAGGVGINTNNPARMLHMRGDESNTPTMLFESDDAPEERRIAALFMNVSTGHMSIGRMTDDGASLDSTQFQIRSDNGYVGIGRSGGSIAHPLHMASGAHVTAAGSWENVSDRNSKMAFESVDVAAALQALADLPLSTWEYKAEPGVRHLGPMAQDFAAAFGLGSNDSSISTVDASGVALAAIQGMHAELVKERERNDELEQRLAALESLLLDERAVASER
jgi:trimeric autotransporter adhesin